MDSLPSSSAFATFWTERHLATLATQRPDGSPHVTAVGVTLDLESAVARVICSGSSRKARNVLAAAAAGDLARSRVAVCQLDGARWSTLEGLAVVRSDPESVALAEQRYAGRYRTPRVNPTRVVIEFTVDRVLGLT